MNGWRVGGAFAAWATLLAPPLVVLAWLSGLPAWPAPLLAALLAPWLFGVVMRALRGSSARLRWWWMQAFGLGALLMPVVVLGGVLRIVLAPVTTGLLALAAWLVVALRASLAAQHVHVVRLDLDAPGLAAPLRIVQLSDVHVGSRSARFLERVVERARELEPDLVLITGDLLDTDDRPAGALDALADLDAPCIMSIGNHERYTRLEHSLAEVRATGVRVLRDEALELPALPGLRLIGVDDRDRPDALPEVLARIAAGSPPTASSGHGPFELLLYHRPDGWAAARAAGIPLMLAGHTHGGQIWPFGLAVRRAYPETTGRFDADGATLYVSSGTGTWGPMFRLGTRCEMTLVELTPVGHGREHDRGRGHGHDRDQPVPSTSSNPSAS